MPAISAIFLVLSLALAITIGPQTRVWSWGPALILLGLSLAASIPTFLKDRRPASNPGLIFFGASVAAWFAWRAWGSPVAELGQADLVLLVVALSSCICIRSILGDPVAEQILIWGIAFLTLGNCIVIAKQVLTPDFIPIFSARPVRLPSGFFSHYNEAANFHVASSMILGAAALFSKGNKSSRWIWALVTLLSLASIHYTRSRGGILALVGASGVLTLAAILLAKQRKSRWFAPALVGIPILGLLIGTYLFFGWQDAQNHRQQSMDIAKMLDNTSRLHLLGVAVSTTALHPLVGGGSRSFSWESFHFLNHKSHGESITHKPEFVHHELLQALTDYGIIGLALVIGLMLTLFCSAIIRMVTSDQENAGNSVNFWWVGAMAALAGMLIQSCFSFVFHLIPGVLLLGMCLGALSCPNKSTQKSLPLKISRTLLGAISIGSLAILFPYGWLGTAVTHRLWDTYLSKNPQASNKIQAKALSEAVKVWPQANLYGDRATLYHTMAVSMTGPDATDFSELAIADYMQASRFHPFDPTYPVNLANLLSHFGRNEDAEENYKTAIRLQGGMEPAFRGRFSYANHLLARGAKEFTANNPSAALTLMESAAELMEEAVGSMHWITGELKSSRVQIHESLGAAREATGDLDGAMAAYQFASNLPGGGRVHYRIGFLLGKLAYQAWYDRRPSEAMALFIQAKQRAKKSKELPPGVSHNDRVEFLTTLDNAIAFFKKAKVTPAPAE
jgi:tetratricopeptide (TPR) repeat protein/NADH:ubiquinone oxidoreductase subunit 6 (subunit J)